MLTLFLYTDKFIDIKVLNNYSVYAHKHTLVNQMINKKNIWYQDIMFNPGF